MINLIILIVSICIYASFGITNLIYILFSTITTYVAAKCFNKKHKKVIFILTLLLNASILIIMKLLTYAQTNFEIIQEVSIIAPLGISYYTLQVISYLIDVYKGKYEPEKKFINYLLYVMYIPYLFIGPIMRYDEMKQTLFVKRKFEFNNIYNGTIRILWGLFKKLIIASRLAIVIQTIASNVAQYNGAYALFAMILYSIQLFSDFSGGIDIVIGISKILGINLKENFDTPYLAQNIKEFWRRWHISLSNWLRDYIYIPLGGNRCSKIRNKINVIITFLVSGFWHGMNYLLWGLIHGILVIYSNFLTTKSKWLNRVITFILVSVLWSFFIWPNTITSLQMIGSIFTTWNYAELFSNITQLGISMPNIIVLIVSVIVLVISGIKKEKITQLIKKSSTEAKITIISFFIIIILVFGFYGIGFEVSEFIYSKF